MRDGPNQPAADLKAANGICHHHQGFGGVGSEALVNERAVEVDGPREAGPRNWLVGW
jgi:hypothetical protein